MARIELDRLGEAVADGDHDEELLSMFGLCQQDTLLCLGLIQSQCRRQQFHEVAIPLLTEPLTPEWITTLRENGVSPMVLRPVVVFAISKCVIPNDATDDVADALLRMVDHPPSSARCKSLADELMT